jgi:excinuclease UvrABC helicase subunit UvrB
LEEVGNTKDLGEFDEDDDSSDEDNIEQLELDDPFNHDVYSDDNDSIEELQNKLKEAIEREEYEIASRLRDEIAKRTF